MVYSAFAGSVTLTDYASSATALEGDTFDQCGGHAATTFSSSYHVHVPPACLLNQLGATTSAHSPQVGWMYDGFPIYGNRGPSGVLMERCSSSSQTDSSSTPCVDDCGGRASSTQPNDGYNYRYYILGESGDGTTCTSPISPLSTAAYYPFTPICLKGCCPAGASCNSVVPACASSGTSTGYSAVATPTYPTGLSQYTSMCTKDEVSVDINEIVVYLLCGFGAVAVIMACCCMWFGMRNSASDGAQKLEHGPNAGQSV